LSIEPIQVVQDPVEVSKYLRSQLDAGHVRRQRFIRRAVGLRACSPLVLASR
jgi:hypothetical protein